MQIHQQHATILHLWGRGITQLVSGARNANSCTKPSRSARVGTWSHSVFIKSAKSRFFDKSLVGTWNDKVYMRGAKWRFFYKTQPFCIGGNVDSLGIYKMREVQIIQQNITILNLWERGSSWLLWSVWRPDLCTERDRARSADSFIKLIILHLCELGFIRFLWGARSADLRTKFDQSAIVGTRNHSVCMKCVKCILFDTTRPFCICGNVDPVGVCEICEIQIFYKKRTFSMCGNVESIGLYEAYGM